MNPTGSTYLSANLNYVWQDGDVYLIPQTDTVEAAGSGASFNGLGVANQPHQQLLNKTQQLHIKQLADEATLASLESFFESFQSDLGAAGWIKIADTDTHAGPIELILQWGFSPVPPFLAPPPPASTYFQIVQFDFVTAFTGLVFWVLPGLLFNQTGAFHPVGGTPVWQLGTVTLTGAHLIIKGNQWQGVAGQLIYVAMGY